MGAGRRQREGREGTGRADRPPTQPPSLPLQEEPKTQGPWRFVQPRVATALRELEHGGGGGRALRYIGRPPAGTTATASLAIHRDETRAIVDAALGEGLVPTGAEGLALQ